MKKRLSFFAAALLIAAAAVPVTPAGAAEPAGIDACCNVVSIDRAKGLVTIRNLQTRAVTTVRIRDAAALGRLKVGLKVQANGLPAR